MCRWDLDKLPVGKAGSPTCPLPLEFTTCTLPTARAGWRGRTSLWKRTSNGTVVGPTGIALDNGALCISPSRLDREPNMEQQHMAFADRSRSSALAGTALLATQHLESVLMPQLPDAMKNNLPRSPVRTAPFVEPVLQLLPKPASEQVTFTDTRDGSGEEQIHIVVLDVGGRVVAQIPMNAAMQTWDLHTVAPGTYLVQYWAGGQLQRGEQLIIQR
jgi:hypothetical protein